MKTNNEDFLDDMIRKLEEKLHDEYNVSPLVYVQLESLIEKKAINDTTNEIFAELDNLHIVENWSNQKRKGIPLLLKQIGAYNAVKKKYLLRTQLHPQGCKK